MPFTKIRGEQIYLDDSSISVNASHQLEVKDAGITPAKLATTVAGDGLSGGNGAALSINVDNSTLEIVSDALQVKDDGITKEKINADVAGAGLSQDTDGSLKVNVDDNSIEINADVIRVKDEGITEAKLASSVAGNGLTGGAGNPLTVNVDNSTIEIVSDTLQVKDGGITTAKIANDAVDNTKLDLTKTYDFASEGGKILVGTPSANNDAANKAYVDSVAQGLDVKESVRCATTTNITLSGLQTIDGVSVAEGDRVLVKNQTNGVENGIYIASSGNWTRADDFASGDNVAGAFCFVEEGTNYADTGWVCTNDSGSDTVGTDSLSFTQFSGAGSIEAGDGLGKSGNTLYVNVDNSTIEIVSDTLQVKDGGITTAKISDEAVTEAKLDILDTPNDGEFLSWNASQSKMEWKPIAETYVQESDFVMNETPSGDINGTNTTFTLANTPVEGTVEVYLNGILQAPGSGKDYTISGNTITFTQAPETGDVILVSYVKD